MSACLLTMETLLLSTVLCGIPCSTNGELSQWLTGQRQNSTKSEVCLTDRSAAKRLRRASIIYHTFDRVATQSSCRLSSYFCSCAIGHFAQICYQDDTELKSLLPAHMQSTSRVKIQPTTPTRMRLSQFSTESKRYPRSWDKFV